MTSMTASQARANLYRLMESVAAAHEPIRITGKKTDSVLVSAEDWRSIQETLYLSSVPGMKESLLKSKKAPLKSFSKKRPW